MTVPGTTDARCGSEREALLDARTRAVAALPGAEEGRGRGSEVLVFRVGGRQFGMAPECVRRVVSSEVVSGLPGGPKGVVGIALLDDVACQVLDPRAKLGVEGRGCRDLAVVLLVEASDARFGVAVEALEGLVAVPTEERVVVGSDGVLWTAGGLVVVDPGVFTAAG